MKIRIYVLNGIVEPIEIEELEGELDRIAERISQLLKQYDLLMIEVR